MSRSPGCCVSNGWSPRVLFDVFKFFYEIFEAVFFNVGFHSKLLSVILSTLFVVPIRSRLQRSQQRRRWWWSGRLSRSRKVFGIQLSVSPFYRIFHCMKFLFKNINIFHFDDHCFFPLFVSRFCCSLLVPETSNFFFWNSKCLRPSIFPYLASLSLLWCSNIHLC